MKLRRVIASLGMVLTIMGSCMSVSAAKVNQVPASEIDGVFNQSVQSNQLEGWAKGPHLYSEAGIVMDIDSGAILYAKNIDDPHYPASITKVMTALVALENNELTDKVTIQQEDIAFLEPGDAHIGMRVGEEITMEDALHGMLLASGNEVSHAIGSNTPGGYENFLRLMNEKAKELGCTNSNFKNLNGLHDPEHYVSARDMALIGAAVYKYDDFRRITNTLQYTIPETNLVNEKRTFQQHHKMLFDWRDEYYEPCTGGKTGYTSNSLNTLVTFAEKDGMRLVAVTLRAHGGSVKAYADTESMLNYCFESFKKVPVSVEQIQAEGLASVKANSYVMLPDGITLDKLECEVKNPTTLGDKTGEVVYTYQGQPVGTVETTITDEYYNTLHGIVEIEEEEKKEEDSDSLFAIILKVILGIIVVGALLFILLLCYATYRKRQRQKRRRAQRMKRKRQNEYRRYVEREQNRDR